MAQPGGEIPFGGWGNARHDQVYPARNEQRPAAEPVRAVPQPRLRDDLGGAYPVAAIGRHQAQDQRDREEQEDYRRYEKRMFTHSAPCSFPLNRQLATACSLFPSRSPAAAAASSAAATSATAAASARITAVAGRIDRLGKEGRDVRKMAGWKSGHSEGRGQENGVGITRPLTSPAPLTYRFICVIMPLV
jgi:hypothetical protein